MMRIASTYDAINGKFSSGKPLFLAATPRIAGERHNRFVDVCWLPNSSSPWP